MTAALACFGKAWGRKNFAGKFLRAANIDQRVAFRRNGLLHLRQKRPQRVVSGLRGIRLGRKRRLVSAELPAFGEPLLSAAVHDPHVLMTVNLQLPERPRGKPVVVV